MEVVERVGVVEQPWGLMPLDLRPVSFARPLDDVQVSNRKITVEPTEARGHGDIEIQRAVRHRRRDAVDRRIVRQAERSVAESAHGGTRLRFGLCTGQPRNGG